MEAAFRAHPLWAGCSEEELDSAGEGLEKYVMTKLFYRVFGSLPGDVKHDEQLSEKMALIQQFVGPRIWMFSQPFRTRHHGCLHRKNYKKSICTRLQETSLFVSSIVARSSIFYCLMLQLLQTRILLELMNFFLS